MAIIHRARYRIDVSALQRRGLRTDDKHARQNGAFQELLVELRMRTADEWHQSGIVYRGVVGLGREQGRHVFGIDSPVGQAALREMSIDLENPQAEAFAMPQKIMSVVDIAEIDQLGMAAGLGEALVICAPDFLREKLVALAVDHSEGRRASRPNSAIAFHIAASCASHRFERRPPTKLMMPLIGASGGRSVTVSTG